MKVFCVRIGNKYGPEYEDYIERKLHKYDVEWIREPFDDRVQLQWNKMLPMSYDIDEPICVVDIDIFLTNDYEKIFDFPVFRGQFLTAPNWWSNSRFDINGGFFKYYPVDCNYIFEEFMSDPLHWQKHFIELGVTSGPVNGEQHFVKQLVEEELVLNKLPDAWFTRWTTENYHKINIERSEDVAILEWENKMNNLYRERTGNDYLFLGGEFHEDIKFVHFTHSMNKPHESSLYKEFV